MSHLPFTLLAYLFNSVSVLIGKFLINKSIPDPFVYIFYISALSLLALFGLPLVSIPKQEALLLSSISTLLWTLGAYFMFKALKEGLVSRVVPVIGTLIPLILLIWASTQNSISQNETWAVGFLIVGLVFITLTDWKGRLTKKELLFEIVSATLFAISYILLRESYKYSDFVSVLVYSRLILIPVGIAMLLIPNLRSRIVKRGESTVNFFGVTGVLFLVGQICGGISEFLLLFSISLANPSLVNSLQGTQYIFLLIFGLILAKKFPEVFQENFSKKEILTKAFGILFIGLGLYTLAFAKGATELKLGVTFSPRYAHQLGLNPQMIYTDLLNLGIKRVRLPVYWDEVETFPKKLTFSGLDFYLTQAQIRGVEVVLVIGHKQPRWPECFAPAWVNQLMDQEKEVRILELLRAEVEYFKKYPNITSWQVENEPYFNYGICQPGIIWNLPKEVELVKSLDSRPVLVTDSGEIGLWYFGFKNADIFGSTLYRRVWDPRFGSVTYPLPPIYYKAKYDLTRLLTGKFKTPTIVSELQAEPWIPASISPREYSFDKQPKLMTVADLENNLNYAKEAGFSEIYLWGVEWWYFMDKFHHPEYLEYAKSLFKENL